jgi:hypothetical protein
MVGRGAGSGRMEARLRQETRFGTDFLYATGEAGSRLCRTSAAIVDDNAEEKGQYGGHENTRRQLRNHFPFIERI